MLPSEEVLKNNNLLRIELYKAESFAHLNSLSAELRHEKLCGSVLYDLGVVCWASDSLYDLFYNHEIKFEISSLTGNYMDYFYLGVNNRSYDLEMSYRMLTIICEEREDALVIVERNPIHGELYGAELPDESGVFLGQYKKPEWLERLPNALQFSLYSFAYEMLQPAVKVYFRDNMLFTPEILYEMGVGYGIACIALEERLRGHGFVEENFSMVRLSRYNSKGSYGGWHLLGGLARWNDGLMSAFLLAYGMLTRDYPLNQGVHMYISQGLCVQKPEQDALSLFDVDSSTDFFVTDVALNVPSGDDDIPRYLAEQYTKLVVHSDV